MRQGLFEYLVKSDYGTLGYCGFSNGKVTFLPYKTAHFKRALKMARTFTNRTQVVHLVFPVRRKVAQLSNAERLAHTLAPMS